jgi:hypothetical protein
MGIDLSGFPARLLVAPGGETQLVLPSYAGSGNVWSAHPVSDEPIAEVRVETVLASPRADPVVPPGGGPPEPVLAGERLVVKGLNEGTTRWLLTLSRPFGPPDPTATVEVEIVVIHIQSRRVPPLNGPAPG